MTEGSVTAWYRRYSTASDANHDQAQAVTPATVAWPRSRSLPGDLRRLHECASMSTPRLEKCMMNHHCFFEPPKPPIPIMACMAASSAVSSWAAGAAADSCAACSLACCSRRCLFASKRCSRAWRSASSAACILLSRSVQRTQYLDDASGGVRHTVFLPLGLWFASLALQCCKSCAYLID